MTAAAATWTREMERQYGEQLGRLAFRRVDDRHSSRRRTLDCGHVIDPREPYRYTVSKTVGVHGLSQTAECDACMRAGHRY